MLTKCLPLSSPIIKEDEKLYCAKVFESFRTLMLPICYLRVFKSILLSTVYISLEKSHFYLLLLVRLKYPVFKTTEERIHSCGPSFARYTPDAGSYKYLDTTVEIEYPAALRSTTRKIMIFQWKGL